jgi:serine protease
MKIAKTKLCISFKFFATFLIAFVCQTTLAIAPEGKKPQVFVDKENIQGIIVRYRDSSLQRKSAVDRTPAVSKRVGARFEYFRAMSGSAHVLRLPEKITLKNAEKLAKRIAQDPDVLYAEPDAMMQIQLSPNDTEYSQQWHYFEAAGGLNIEPAWDKSTGSSVVVAVIDTGYRPHVDLDSNILPGYDFISNVTIANDGDGRDADASDPGDWTASRDSSWHGTHVAGTIAAETNNAQGVAGVAFDAKILPVRVLGAGGGSTSDIADAIRWAAGLSVPGVPDNPNPAQVLNMSLGRSGICGQTYLDAVNAVRAQNTTVVVAAGNSTSDAVNFQPANCAGVIAVAATNRSGGRASYSNFGAVVDVAAPGGETVVMTDGVLSTLNYGTTSPGIVAYDFYQGTSMAAQHVAGAVALLYALKGSITPDEVESILEETARAFPSTCNECGAGIVDADAAVSVLYSDPILHWLIPVLGLLLSD